MMELLRSCTGKVSVHALVQNLHVVASCVIKIRHHFSSETTKNTRRLMFMFMYDTSHIFLAFLLQNE